MIVLELNDLHDQFGSTISMSELLEGELKCVGIIGVYTKERIVLIYSSIHNRYIYNRCINPLGEPMDYTTLVRVARSASTIAKYILSYEHHVTLPAITSLEF